MEIEMNGYSQTGQSHTSSGKQTLPGKRAGRLILAALALACTNALAQAAPEPAATEDATPLSSSEQGQVSLDESFTKTRRELIIEQRRKALQDIKVDAQLRYYLLDRDKFDESEMSAMALGGHIGFKTGYFRDRFALGTTVYTSQKLYGPEDKDGTLLLEPGQESYTVVGELYGQFRVTDDIMLDIGRKELESPYINKQDNRMTPNTFEAIMLGGTYAVGDNDGKLRFGLGYVDEMKKRNSTDFISMAQAAGALAGVERGVYAAGFNYIQGQLSVGAVNYYSDDIMNTFYTEAKYNVPLSEDRYKLKLAAQYSAQDSTGDELLTGSSFSTSQLGIKAELAVGSALFTTAWNSTGDGADLRSPWGSIPSYNSVQVQDFNRAGEDSLMLRAAYNFKSVPNLSAYALWVNGSQPEDPGQSAQDEYDFNIQWNASSGTFKGFSLRARYAVVTQDMGGPDLQDFRLILNYDPPGL
jgi:hypothetical protein